jgi:NAD+ kinase
MTRALVICKQTFYERHLAKTSASVRPLRLRLDKHAPLFQRMLRTHESQHRTVERAEAVLRGLGVHADFETERTEQAIPPSRFAAVITIGGDGTLLLASHRLGATTPILGINGAPETSVGFFCAGSLATLDEALSRAFLPRSPRLVLERMEVSLDGKRVSARVLNEALFCHRSPAATSRYILRVETGTRRIAEEEQRSSGIFVGPAAGSTAAQRSAGGKILPLSSKSLQFVVREPIVNAERPMKLRTGLIKDAQTLEIECTFNAGKLFLDGHETFVDVPLGAKIRAVRSSEQLTVLGLQKRRA